MQKNENTFKLKLRNYQIEDVKRLTKLYVGACFNEQRTGKTPTALRTLYYKKCKKILIICPQTCILPWTAEYEKWLELPCIACIGTREKQKKLIKQWTDGLVVSYDSIRATKNTTGLIKEILEQNPDAVILDEAHRIKDHNTYTAKSIQHFSKIKHKIALTATPAPNYPYEVFGILKFLFPIPFKSYWKFIEYYFKTTQQQTFNGGSLRTYTDIGTFKPGKATELQNLLNTFATSRKRKEVLPWLAPKDYMQIKLEPTKSQSNYLEQLTNYFEIKNSDVICKGVLDRLTAYRQLCISPELLNLKGKSAKLEWLKQYFIDYPDTRPIIFTKFKKAIPHILNTIPLNKKAAVIHGDISLKCREKIRQDFQNKELDIIVAQIDTCKEGLTFDTADTIIFMDKYPPVSDILQAEDRFVATANNENNKPKLIIELILKNTYDEHIYDLIKDNKSEIDIINNFKNYKQKEIDNA